MFEKRGEQSNPTNEQSISQTNILVVVNPTYRQTVEDMLHRYGYSREDYSVAPDISTGRRMVDGKSVVITDDSAIAFKAKSSKVIRTDSDDFSEQLKSTLEGKVSVYGQEIHEAQKTKKKRVLVVDDDKNYLTLCKQTLKNLGYEVKTIDNEDGKIEENAIYEIAETGSDIVILNYDVDKTNTTTGLRLLLILKGFFCDMPIIVQTEYDNNRVNENATKNGVYAVIRKSSDLTELTDSVAKALGLQQALVKAGQSPTPFSDGTIDRYIEKLQGSEKEPKPETTTDRFERELEKAHRE